MKKVNVFVALLFGLLIIASLVQAIPSAEDLQNDSVVRGLNRFQNWTEGEGNFTEDERWEYLGEQWRQTFLQSKTIATVDSFLKSLNFLFVILLSRDYALSLTLFIAFLLWLFTAISLEGYLYTVVNKRSYRNLMGFAGAIILSHMQVFNFISEGAFKIIMYKKEWWWILISILLVFVVIFLYWKINNMFIASIKKGHEDARKKHFEQKTKELEEHQKGVDQGSSG
ncbi:MAG: hypothetical protein ABIH92_00165 [Nanoarchaeota archaeon]